MFDYDESGDNTFEIYPAFVSNTKNYNFELEDFYADIINQQRNLAVIQVGNLIRYRSGFLEMYVKLINPRTLITYEFDQKKFS